MYSKADKCSANKTDKCLTTLQVDEAIARAQNVLKTLNEAKYIAITKQLALSSRETRKRFRRMKKFKRRKKQ